MIYAFLIFLMTIYPNHLFEYDPKIDKIKEREIVLIYIGSSNCPICTDDLNSKYFNSILKKIKVRNSRFGFRAIGISLDQSPQLGYSFLNKVSKNFDEMIVGGNVNNIGALRYLQENFKGRGFIPQLLIILREYDQIVANDIAINISIKNEILAYRILGLGKIKNFTTLIDNIDLGSLFENIDKS